MKAYLLALILLLACPLAAVAQHDAPAPTAANAPAETRQFDFLLGQWELEVHPKVSGLAAMIHGTPKLVGTWKAWRALDGLAIEDEMRIVDASGNPLSLTRALRVYAKADARWRTSGVDAYRGRVSTSSGAMQGAEMHLDGQSIDSQDKPTLTRTRYYDITADSFRMLQDRSSDNGQTWDEGVLSIDAKRTAATATP